MSEQPIELRLAVAEARIEALTAVVIAIAECVQHQNQAASDNMWGKIDGLEHAGAEILQATPEQLIKNIRNDIPPGHWKEVPLK